MTILDALDLYAGSKLRFSARTNQEYRTTINNLSLFLGRAALMADLNDATLLSFLRWRLEHRSAATARKDRQQLLALWRWAWRKNHTDLQPRDIPEVLVPRRRVRAWSPDEVAQILRAAKTAPVAEDWGPREWSALLLTIYDSAERISALLRCPANGFHADRRLLVVPASVRKFGQADQTSSLHATTCEALGEMLAGRTTASPKLFVFSGCYQTLLRRFRRLLETAGIDSTGRKLFHDLRRTSFTLTYAALGREAARNQCGHSSDLSRYYLDLGLLAELTPEARVADAIVRPS